MTGEAVTRKAGQIAQAKVRERTRQLGDALEEALPAHAHVAVEADRIAVSMPGLGRQLVRHPELRDIGFLMRSLR